MLILQVLACDISSYNLANRCLCVCVQKDHRSSSSVRRNVLAARACVIVWFLPRRVSSFLHSYALPKQRPDLISINTEPLAELNPSWVCVVSVWMGDWTLRGSLGLIHCDGSNKLSHHLIVLDDSISNTEAGANEADRERARGRRLQWMRHYWREEEMKKINENNKPWITHGGGAFGF